MGDGGLKSVRTAGADARSNVCVDCNSPLPDTALRIRICGQLLVSAPRIERKS